MGKTGVLQDCCVQGPQKVGHNLATKRQQCNEKEDSVTVSYEKEAKRHDNQLECISWMRSQVKLKNKRQVSY